MIDIEKMSRTETIRALRACGTLGGKCDDCPLYKPGSDPFYDCAGALTRHAADVLEASVSVQYERGGRDAQI